MTPESNLFASIGKQINNEYGRAIGRVASLAVNPNGRVDSAYIEQGNGRLVKYPAGSMQVEGSEIILLSALKMKAATLCDQIPLIWRKDKALKELVEKEKISPEMYEDLHQSFDGALNQLKTEAQALTEEIDTEITRCTQETRDLNYALVNLEIEHEIGKIDEESYQNAFRIIQECLKKANMEKSDLETTKNELSNILLGETLPQTEMEHEVTDEPVEGSQDLGEAPIPPTPSSSLPEPPVVVYVKEAGESST